MRSISVIGNVNVDLLVSPVAELPPPGTDLPVENMDVRAAGAAGNTALALAALGVQPQLVGCVGDDQLGSFLIDELRTAGIKGGVSVVSHGSTGISIAFESSNRDRSFLTLLGCLEQFEASMVPRDAIEKDFVLLCGYFNLPALRGAGALRLLKEAKIQGAITLLDTGWDPAGWPDETREELTVLLPFVDAFLPNETEARHLTGRHDPAEAARILQELSGGWIIVKLGPEGCVAAGPSKRLRAEVPSVRVTDTTGAGDALNAGLLYSLSHGASWAEALTFATRLASTVVSRPSKNRYPTLNEIIPSP